MHELNKRFELSNKEKKIAGVCGGMYEYFGVDVVFIRVLFLGSIFLGGFGIVLYVLFWLIAPRSSN